MYDKFRLSRTFNIWVVLVAFFLIAGTLTSLHFMYNVRTAKAA